MARAFDPTNEELFVGAPGCSRYGIDGLGLCVSNLRNHKDAAPRVSRNREEQLPGIADPHVLCTPATRIKAIYFSELMSITKRYFTSLLSMRS
jgi:hypothetical protein